MSPVDVGAAQICPRIRLGRVHRYLSRVQACRFVPLLQSPVRTAQIGKHENVGGVIAQRDLQLADRVGLPALIVVHGAQQGAGFDITRSVAQNALQALTRRSIITGDQLTPRRFDLHPDAMQAAHADESGAEAERGREQHTVRLPQRGAPGIRSHDRHREADKTADDQAADVSRVIDPAVRESVDQVVDDEPTHPQAARPSHAVAKRGKCGNVPEVDEGQQRPRDAEDCARGTRGDDLRVESDAQHIAPHSTHHVQGEKLSRPKETLGQRSQIRQAQHVQQDVDDADVHEHGGEDAPPLAAQFIGSIARAPLDQVLGRRRHRRDPGDHHREVDEDVDADEHPGDADAGHGSGAVGAIQRITTCRRVVLLTTAQARRERRCGRCGRCGRWVSQSSLGITAPSRWALDKLGTGGVSYPDMAAHSIGSATVSFGLVSVPVQLFAAGESKAAISFNLLHKTDGSRLKQQYVCVKDGEKVERSDMIKGYEFQKGQYVTFTPDELKALEERGTGAVEIKEFLPAEQVDRIYLDRTYFLGPDKGGERAYKLLSEALEKTKRVAIGQYAARGKQYLIMVRPLKGGLVMEQLRYADEIRDIAEVPIPKTEVKKPELDLAVKLIEQAATEEFEPKKYKDNVRERMQEQIERKVEGKQITEEPEEAPKAKVLDLMQALKQSLGSAEEKAEEKPAKRRKVAGKR